MKKRKKTEAKTSTKILSGFFFLAGLAALVLIGISLGKETYRKKQIQGEIEVLQKEINQLHQENSELENLTTYFSSEEFQEREAREKLNLQKEDEKMVVLRKEMEQPEEEKKEEETKEKLAVEKDGYPNWQKWIIFFFEEKNL